MANDPTKKPSTPTATAGTAAPPFQITPMKQMHRYIKCCFYGAFGTGKTTLAGSAVDVEEMRDVLYVSAESGTMSIEESDKIKHVDLIDNVRVTDFKMVARVQEFLKAHILARDAYLKGGANKEAALQRLVALQSRMFGNMPAEAISIDHETDEIGEDGIYTQARLRLYRTAVIDSLTEVDTFSMYQLLNIQTDMKLDADMDVAQFAEFRKNNQLMQLLVRAYRDLDMNVIIICAAKYTQDELKRFLWGPALTGQLAGQVQGFVDVVGFIQTAAPKEGEKEVARRLWIQPVGKFDAKTRMASFKDPYIDAPDMTKIMLAFKGKAKTFV